MHLLASDLYSECRQARTNQRFVRFESCLRGHNLLLPLPVNSTRDPMTHLVAVVETFDVYSSNLVSGDMSAASPDLRPPDSPRPSISRSNSFTSLMTRATMDRYGEEWAGALTLLGRLLGPTRLQS